MNIELWFYSLPLRLRSLFYPHQVHQCHCVGTTRLQSYPKTGRRPDNYEHCRAYLPEDAQDLFACSDRSGTKGARRSIVETPHRY